MSMVEEDRVLNYGSDSEQIPCGQGEPLIKTIESNAEMDTVKKDYISPRPVGTTPILHTPICQVNTLPVTPSIPYVSPNMENIYKKFYHELEYHRGIYENLSNMRSLNLTPKGLKITAQPWYTIPHDLQQEWEDTLENTSSKLLDILIVHHERQINKNDLSLSKTKELISNPDVVEHLNKICSTKNIPPKRPSSTPLPPHLPPKKSKPDQNQISQPNKTKKPLTPSSTKTTKPQNNHPKHHSTPNSQHHHSRTPEHRPHSHHNTPSPHNSHLRNPPHSSPRFHHPAPNTQNHTPSGSDLRQVRFSHNQYSHYLHRY